MKQEPKTAKIIIRTDPEIKEKLEEISKSNSSNSLNFTLNMILKQYLELYGIYHDPADNIFLREFKDQVAETQNHFTDQVNDFLNKMVAAMNTNTEAFTKLAVADKENSIEVGRLLDLMENEIGFLGGDNIEFTEGDYE